MSRGKYLSLEEALVTFENGTYGTLKWNDLRKVED